LYTISCASLPAQAGFAVVPLTGWDGWFGACPVAGELTAPADGLAGWFREGGRGIALFGGATCRQKHTGVAKLRKITNAAMRMGLPY
jgi:hypothetical protein